MSKPLPEHVTRAEAAKVLRLSVRQVDRLAEAGKLPKRKLSAARSGFAREDLDRYLASLADGDGYRSTIDRVTLGLPANSPINANDAAETLDAVLAKCLPGCLVGVVNGDIQIAWNTALGYTPEQILASMKG